MAQTSRWQFGTLGVRRRASPSRGDGMTRNRAVGRAIVLVGLISATDGEAAPTKGSRYLVEGRCVTITRVQGDQASYTWKEELASGSGTLMRSDLTQPCQGPAAPQHPSADGPAPRPGDRYMVDGRCVTLNKVNSTMAFYAWSEGNVSGGGALGVLALKQRCRGSSPAQPSAPEPAAAPGPAAALPPSTALPPATALPSAAALPPAREAAGNTTGGSATGGAAADFAQEILDAHNRYRCMHGVPPLKWNADVAAYAQHWVKGLRGLKHSDAYKSAIGPLGENLYGASGMPVLGADAAAAWYREVADYGYGGKNRGQAGHFTAMMWKDVKYLGCGRANGIVSCNYWSGAKESNCSVPNMPGCFREQVLRPVKDAAACK